MQDELTAQIAQDLGIGALPIEKQKELISQFGEVALKSATMSILDKLSVEKRDEFMKLSQAGDVAALQAFLDTEVPEHEQIAKQAVAEEIARFKDFQTT